MNAPAKALLALFGSGLVAGQAVASSCPLGDMVSYWRFDESSGTTAYDSVGPNDGMINGATSIPGPRGNALDFDGDNDRVDVGAFNVPGAALTIMAWIKADDLDGDARIVSKATGVNEQDHFWMLSERNDRLRFRLKAGGTTTTLEEDSTSLPTNTWVHVAATYDGSDMRIYQDGVLLNSVGKTGDLVDASVATWIGANPGGSGSNWFDGAIDEVAIFNRALTGGEISGLINGAYCKPAPVPALGLPGLLLLGGSVLGFGLLHVHRRRRRT